MGLKENILQYELCIICNSDLAKMGSKYCKKCRIKPIRARAKIKVKNDDSCKIYYYKFQDKDTKARLRLNNSKFDTGLSLCIGPSSSDARPFHPIQNSELFFLSTWNQFRSLKEFTACIIQSDQISFAYFIISCSTFIKSLPKFQHFIKSKVIDLPSDNFSHNTVLPYPITSPLQLLYQPRFWDELILLYFKEFHPICPLFSIQFFDQKIASPYLLSAMHYCAYRFSKEQPKEVTEYIEKLAAHNIKKIVKNATIDNLRALIMHTYMSQWDGNLTLAKSLQAHLSRMSYLLGLHMKCSSLSPIDHYNRKILFFAARIANIGLSGSQNFTPRYLTTFDKAEPYLYDTKWQFPSPNSPIYSENQLENELYSHCLTIFFKFTDISAREVWFPSFLKLETSSFNEVWHSKVNKIKEMFEIALRTLEDLKVKYYEFKTNIESFETKLKMKYHDSIIEMHEVLKHKNETLQPSEISNIIYHCHNLYQVISTTKNYNTYFQFYTYTVGLHYLNIYPKCAPDERIRIKQKLQDLILFMRDKFFSYFSLNYLILKTGYDSLDGN